jgi:hypothetical protein
MDIGTIGASTSHLRYLCRVFGQRDVAQPPTADDHGVGAFVSIALPSDRERKLIGIIADSILINPEYGNYGPRLSSAEELTIFSPDALDERGILVVIQVLGYVDEHGPHHDIPPWTAHAGALVSTLTAEDVIAFHRAPDGSFMMGYQPRMIQANDVILSSILLNTIERLAPSFPDQTDLLGLLRETLAWQTAIGPMART